MLQQYVCISDVIDRANSYVSKKRSILPVQYYPEKRGNMVSEVSKLNTRIVKLESDIAQKNKAITILHSEIRIINLSDDELDEVQDMIDEEDLQINPIDTMDANERPSVSKSGNAEKDPCKVNQNVNTISTPSTHQNAQNEPLQSAYINTQCDSVFDPISGNSYLFRQDVRSV